MTRAQFVIFVLQNTYEGVPFRAFLTAAIWPLEFLPYLEFPRCRYFCVDVSEYRSEIRWQVTTCMFSLFRPGGCGVDVSV